MGPLRKMKIRPNYQKGLSAKTIKLKKQRDRERIASNTCKDPVLKRSLTDKYHKSRNHVTSQIRKERKRFNINSVKHSGNPAEKWKVVQTMGGSMQQQTLILKEKILLCSLCNQNYEKPFTCKQCDKSFADKDSLKRHESSHKHETLFTCSLCN